MIRMFLLSLFYFIFTLNLKFYEAQEVFCDKDSTCNSAHTLLPPRYLLYDVNFPEGFNLRRDVYMRMAIFIKNLVSSNRKNHWHLVLPPWHHLYHWRSRDLGKQQYIAWSKFFHIESLKKFAPVMEMSDFLKETNGTEIEILYGLQNYKNAFTENWTWEDKWDFEECNRDYEKVYRREGSSYRGWYWGYPNITASEMLCVSFQGHASMLKQLLTGADKRIVMVDRAEIVLHDHFGDRDYWSCRRSMRFSPRLVQIAAEYRRLVLNSTDEQDNTVKPVDWRQEKMSRDAIGGNYLAVHLRRQEFVESKSCRVPDIEHAVSVIKSKMEELSLRQVFVATDGSEEEMGQLKTLLSQYLVYRYKPDLSTSKEILDGGIAIVDQIICSHARYFIGSHESTFSFRIHEEREILGFPADTTFNRFCPSRSKCQQPSRWTLVH